MNSGYGRIIPAQLRGVERERLTSRPVQAQQQAGHGIAWRQFGAGTGLEFMRSLR